jgi:hypothetical protein
LLKMLRWLKSSMEFWSPTSAMGNDDTEIHF